MLVSLNSYKFSTPNAIRLRNDNPTPAPTQEPIPEAGQEKKSSIYFTGDDNGSSLRKAAAYMAMAATLLTAACSKEDDDITAYANANASATITGTPQTDTTTVDTTWGGKRGRDTIYIEVPGPRDTIVIDTGSYIHDTTYIDRWKYYFNRPIPLDSLMNDLDKFDVDSTSYPNDSTDKRNIIHYEATREWEYNTKEVGDIYMPESSKNILVYNTDIRDYMDNHLSYGKRILRIPTSPFVVETEDGRTLNSPKGYFVEVYSNPTENKLASVYDCNLESREFCQTIGNKVKVFKYKNGKYVEKGFAEKGYLGENTILLRNLIGEYETDDHVTGVKVLAVDDEKLLALYLRQMDEADDQTTRAYMTRAKK